MPTTSHDQSEVPSDQPDSSNGSDSGQKRPLLILGTRVSNGRSEQIALTPLNTTHPHHDNFKLWMKVKHSSLFQDLLSELSQSPDPGQYSDTCPSEKARWSMASSSIQQSLTNVVHEVDGEQTKVGVVVSLLVPLPQLLGRGWDEQTQSLLDSGQWGNGSPFTHKLHLDETDEELLHSVSEASTTSANIGRSSSIETAGEETPWVIRETNWSTNEMYFSRHSDGSATVWCSLDANSTAWIKSGSSGTNREQEGQEEDPYSEGG